MLRIAIYPGTFDPVTNGHMDILKRAVSLFGRVIIAIASNNYKNTLFDLAERINLMHAVTKGMKNVEVDSFEGITGGLLSKKRSDRHH